MRQKQTARARAKLTRGPDHWPGPSGDERRGSSGVGVASAASAASAARSAAGLRGEPEPARSIFFCSIFARIWASRCGGHRAK